MRPHDSKLLVGVVRELITTPLFVSPEAHNRETIAAWITDQLNTKKQPPWRVELTNAVARKREVLGSNKRRASTARAVAALADDILSMVTCSASGTPTIQEVAKRFADFEMRRVDNQGRSIYGPSDIRRVLLGIPGTQELLKLPTEAQREALVEPLREVFASHPEPNITEILLGAPAVRPELTGETSMRVLDPLNRVAVHAPQFARIVLSPALYEYCQPTKRTQLDSISVALSTTPQAYTMPKDRPALAGLLEDWLRLDGRDYRLGEDYDAVSWALDLLTVCRFFSSTGDYYHLRGGQYHEVSAKDVVSAVIADIAKSLDLMQAELSPAENLKRLKARTGVDNLHAGHLKGAPSVLKLVGPAVKPAPSDWKVSKTVNRTETRAFARTEAALQATGITDVASGHEWLARRLEVDGALPGLNSMRETYTEEWLSLEAVFSQPYVELLSYLQETFGYAVEERKASAPERAGYALCDAAFPNTTQSREVRTTKLGIPDTKGNGKGRVDLVIERTNDVPTEIWMEFDGQQHFEPAGIWDFTSTVQRDRLRQRQVRQRNRDGVPATVIALHHKVLVGTGENLTATQLREVEAATRDWCWVFVRPECRSSDMRSHIGTAQKLDTAIEGFEVFVTDKR